MRTYCIAQGTHSVLCGDLNGKEIQKRGDICIHRASLVALVVKNPSANTDVSKKGQVQYLGWEDPLEKKIQPTPAFSPGEFLGQLAGYSP